MIEYFISKRYIFSKKRLNFISVISMVSTIGITIGVAALIIVLSVFNGFGGIVKDILINFDPHLKIQIVSEQGAISNDSLEAILSSNTEIASYNKYVDGKVILLSDNSYEVLNLKGINLSPENSKWGAANSIVSGNFNVEKKQGELSPIILGAQMAMRLSRFVGDTINATSFGDLQNSLLNYLLPKTKQFIVKGIFQTNNKDYDYNSTFTDLNSAQQITGLKKRISGYEIRLSNFENAEKTKVWLKTLLPKKSYSIYTWYDLHKDLYDVMKIERWSAYILLCLIIAVASFNILSSLMMSVIQKRKDIGIMQSMGISKKSIRKIFLFEGIFVSTFGIVLGLVIGLVVCYLQIEYNFYPLDPARYIIDALPVEVKFTDIFATIVAAFILSLISAYIPAKRASKLSVVEAIKWE